MSTPTHVVLVGSMGAGKTTIGTLVAAALGRDLVDNDRVLAREGANAAALARTQGVGPLHERECRQLRAALAVPTPSVVAAAASTVEAPACRAALAGHVVVWLRVDPAVAAGRLGSADDHRRDLGDDPVGAMRQLARRRDPLYAAVATVVVDAGALAPDAAARAVVERVAHLDGVAPAAPT